jgi:hypothetical protein
VGGEEVEVVVPDGQDPPEGAGSQFSELSSTYIQSAWSKRRLLNFTRIWMQLGTNKIHLQVYTGIDM